MADEKIITRNTATGEINAGVPTNVANPTRATIRTVIQNTVSDLIVLVPTVNIALGALNEYLVEQTDVEVPAWVFLVVNGGIVATKVSIAVVTRVMAAPGVAAFIQAKLPWLAPIKR